MLATVLYAWLAVWTPLWGLVVTRASGRPTPWAGITLRATVGVAVLALLWLEGRLVGRLTAAGWPAAIAPATDDGSAASVETGVAWLTLLLPLAIIASIALLLQLLRARAGRPARRLGP